MKKLSIGLIFAGLLLYSSACKEVEEAIIDCFEQIQKVSLTHTVDSENPRKVTFDISYTGDHTLSNSVEWDFGDGQKMTLNGTTAEHTYSAAGTYTAKAMVTITQDDKKCQPEPETAVTVN